MFRVTKGFAFQAARSAPIICKRRKWEFICVLESDKIIAEKREDQVDSILAVFRDIRLHKKHLNRSTSLKNPSPQELAYYCYWMLEPRFKKIEVFIASVSIKEAGGYPAEYIPEREFFVGRTYGPRTKAGRPRRIVRKCKV